MKSTKGIREMDQLMQCVIHLETAYQAVREATRIMVGRGTFGKSLARLDAIKESIRDAQIAQMKSLAVIDTYLVDFDRRLAEAEAQELEARVNAPKDPSKNSFPKGDN